MVLHAEDLTIHTMNRAYQELLGTNDVISLPDKVFGGKDLEEFIKVLNRAAPNAESINTAPIAVSVGPNDSHRCLHTLVPISDARGSIIDRLFV